MSKDTLIRLEMIRRELIVFLICFLVVYILAIAGIIHHRSPAIELITQLPGVLAVACVSYVAVVVLRIIYRVIPQFWYRK